MVNTIASIGLGLALGLIGWGTIRLGINWRKTQGFPYWFRKRP